MGGTLKDGGALMVEAQLALGQLSLDRGEPVAAMEWFRTAARGGDAAAYNMLGRCFERGWGTEPNPSLAATYYTHAMDKGDVWAMFNLADLHARGAGVARDDARALELYIAAAQRGHVKSLNMIGLFHEEGRGVAVSLENAGAFYRAGAEGGDCWAQYNHARLLLENGLVDDALVWLTRTLSSGFPDFWKQIGPALQEHPDPRIEDFVNRLPQA